MSLETRLGVLITAIGADIKTLTNRFKPRADSVASAAAPSINTDTTDIFRITALATNITSMTSGLTGTPVVGQKLWMAITDNGTARTITWGSSFESSTVLLPTTTVANQRMDVGFIWNSITSKWRCVGVA